MGRRVQSGLSCSDRATDEWRGPSAFRIEAGEAKILIDPFLSDNPSSDNG